VDEMRVVHYDMKVEIGTGFFSEKRILIPERGMKCI
jgi:hypothetical protein